MSQGISINTSDAMDGYLLFEIENDQTYLVNNCGEIVHTWDVTNTSLHPKLLPNGNLLYIGNNSVEERTWDGDVVVSLSHGESSLRLHYEVIKLPSGNYLCVGRRNFSVFQFQEIGYDLSGVSPSVVDVVVELDRNSGDVVWEWNISDHVIQERNSGSPNFGNIKNNPQLLDMGSISRYDWNGYESFMINGMDYNPELDQIALSVRKMSEIIIIDHSTTTEEAAGSTGGNMGKGGDILYRWGNPQNYGRGDEDDRTLYYQHNPNWIKYGPHKGKLICYNNGLNNPNTSYSSAYSTVPIFKPTRDSKGNYFIDNTSPFLPVDPEISYDKESVGISFYSSYTSGARVLENGNVFVTQGRGGRMFEIDPVTNFMVWEYEANDPFDSYIFRTEKYSPFYSAFIGRELEPQGTLESPPSSYDCQLHTSNASEILTQEISVNYSLLNQSFNIKFDGVYQIKIYDHLGRHMITKGPSPQLDVSFLRSGTYLLQLIAADKKPIVRKFIVL